MIHFEVSHTFPVSTHDAFSYITDLNNWKTYWPGFVRINNPQDARWCSPGDTVVLIMRLLGRNVALHMTMTDFKQDEFVAYRSRQSGLPDVQHERYWKESGSGCEFRLAIRFEPRGGLAGLFDRFIFQRSIRNAVYQTLKNQDAILRQYSSISRNGAKITLL